jgi:hypothetical protein
VCVFQCVCVCLSDHNSCINAPLLPWGILPFDLRDGGVHGGGRGGQLPCEGPPDAHTAGAVVGCSWPPFASSSKSTLAHTLSLTPTACFGSDNLFTPSTQPSRLRRRHGAQHTLLRAHPTPTHTHTHTHTHTGRTCPKILLT